MRSFVAVAVGLDRRTRTGGRTGRPRWRARSRRSGRSTGSSCARATPSTTPPPGLRQPKLPRTCRGRSRSTRCGASSRRPTRGTPRGPARPRAPGDAVRGRACGSRSWSASTSTTSIWRRGRVRVLGKGEQGAGGAAGAVRPRGAGGLPHAGPTRARAATQPRRRCFLNQRGGRLTRQSVNRDPRAARRERPGSASA